MVGSLLSFRTLSMVWLVAILVSLPTALSLAAVLPPAAGEKLEAAFGELEPEWELGEASIREREVVAKVCAQSACHEVRLTEPSADCDGLSLDAWCVRFGSGATAELRSVIEGEFGGHRPEDFWLVPGADKGGTGIAEEPARSALVPLLLALSLLLLPILAGWVLGAGLRYLRNGRVKSIWGAFLAFLLPISPAFLLPADYLFVGFYDLTLAGLLLGGGVLLGGHKWGGAVGLREGAVLVGGLLAALALLELCVRLLLPAPPAFPPPAEASFLFGGGGAAGVKGQACKGLFPGRFPEIVQARDPFPRRARRVLHVGDSMVEGVGVQPGERFVSLLNDLDLETAHVNAGFSGTGPDFYYLATRRWLALQAGNSVVWYLFLFNDLDAGLSDEYGCCGGTPLLSFASGELAVECTSWMLAEQGSRFRTSPAPYSMRVATAYLRTAGHLVALHNRLVSEPRRETVALDVSLARSSLVLRKMAKELAEEGVEFTVVLLPYRRALEGDDAVSGKLAATQARVLQMCLDVGVRCLDGGEAFGSLAESGSIAAAFVSKPVWDYHFSNRGHRLLAEWLRRVLGGALREGL